MYALCLRKFGPHLYIPSSISSLRSPYFLPLVCKFILRPTFCCIYFALLMAPQQKVVLKVMTMTDDKSKKKAMEAAADCYGIDSISVDLKEQKITVIGEMDSVGLVKRLKKVAKVDIISVGPAKEEKKEEKKVEKKEEKKEVPKEEKKDVKKEEKK
ncbi:heavy metal-associated isoprenylated plant protein 39 isoform X1 [Daucus carota subsp. sativus]|uniref:heavy metal-associated isoprenylated plant protein 39 isoform X1 n=1 Tax=Daucus carota subsp. sativus TaxID=79200 RepID=UPI003082D758